MNQIFRALADPTRRKILQLLRERELAAGEIANQFPFAWPTLSRHLAILREADLIQGDKRGNSILYRLNVSVLEEALLGFMEAFKVERKTEETKTEEDDPQIAQINAD